MRRVIQAFLISSALALAACGGGGDEPVAQAASPLAQLAQQAQAAPAGNPPQATPVLDAAGLFAWAQVQYASIFAGPVTTGVSGPYSYRYYGLSRNYLAVGSDGYVYVLGPVSGNQISNVGRLADFTCVVYTCTAAPPVTPGGGGTGGGRSGSVDWNSSFSASEIIEYSETLSSGRRVGNTFNVTGGSLPVEIIFAAQYTADLYVMDASSVNTCVNGGSFNYYPSYSFVGQYGFNSFTLPPGDYGICMVNKVSQANGVRVEFQNQPTVAGFAYNGTRFATVTRTVAAGGRITQPITVGNNYRTIVDGANSGGTTYVIPNSESANFLAGRAFNYYTTMDCSSGRAAPGLCEITGVGEFAIAYVNDTSASQSLVIVGRDFIPE